MATEETPSGKPEESSTTTTQASAGPSGVTITQQTETERLTTTATGNGGTITVKTNQAAAKFTINGPATYSGSGADFVQSGAPAGTYKITYEAVPEFIPPGADTKTLPAGGSILFEGTYTERPRAETPGGKPEEPSTTTTPPGRIASVVGLGAYNKNVRRIAGWTLTALIFGLLTAALGAWRHWLAALLWASACSTIGWVLGFLFGIPRTLQTEGQSEVVQTQHETPPDQATRSTTARRTTGINTNLEQISDWLTKILVGVTLVQLGEVNERLILAAQLIAESLGGPNMKSFAAALMIYFALLGFLGSYLLTRLFLQLAFEEGREARN